MEIPITKRETEISNEESVYLYGYLRKKYCNEDISHLDICLNSLCFALLRLMHDYVPPKDRKIFADKIIRSIIENGIKE